MGRARTCECGTCRKCRKRRQQKERRIELIKDAVSRGTTLLKGEGRLEFEERMARLYALNDGRKIVARVAAFHAWP